MKVGIDGRLLFRNVTGLERYTLNLCSHLNKQSRNDCSYLLYTACPFEPIRTLGPRFSESVIYSASHLLTRLLRGLETPDLYNLTWPGYNVMDSMLLLLMPRSIYTIYDLIQYANPHYFPSEEASNRYRQMIHMSAHMTDKIITVSNYSRKDIVETLGIPPEKVETIYASADSMFKPISDRSRLEPIRRKFNITGKLIFNLSADYPNKNVKNLILAFSDLSRLEKRRLQLIIAGKRESEKGSDEINQLLDRVPYHENIQWLTHLPDEELILLYNLADVFVFPSLHEGFGLPVLEAMACGTPVVASNATSIPEVAGDAALSVNARNVDEITRAIREILFNIELRQTLVEKGFKQAASFGWERTAVQTQAVYDKVCREVPPRRIEDLPDAMKHWLNRHLAVAAGMEEEIIYLTETINRIDTRLARLRASVPGRIYGALRRLKK